MNSQRRDVNCKEERMNVSNALIGSKVTDIFQDKQIFITNSYIVVLY